MSDERIDIEVTDKVDKSVETKLRSIAKEARDGHSQVQRLKAALADINATPVQRLAAASAQLTNALARELNAQARLTAATAQAGVADAKAAIQKERLAAESLRTATAEQRLAQETAKTAAAQARAETAALRLQQAQSKAANQTASSAREAANLEARIHALRASVDPAGVAFDRLNAELMEAQSLYARGAISATQFAQAEAVLTERINAHVVAQQRVNSTLNGGARAAKLTAQETLNLSRQFSDIGVTAAMGMNPLMILIQQGPQIADVFQTASQRGVGFNAVLGQMFGQVGRLAAILAPFVVVIGAAAAGFGLLHRELSRGYPKDITDGLGLTEEQLERVESRTVTFGDTFMATITVIGRHIMNGPIGEGLNYLGDRFSEFLDWLGSSFALGVAAIIGFFVAAYRTILNNWRRFPQAFGDIVTTGVNAAIGAVEGLLNKGIEGLNNFITQANRLPGVDLPQITPVSIRRVTNASAGVAGEIAEDFDTAFWDATVSARQGMDRLAAEIGSEALARARRRALEEAGDPNKTRTPRGRQPREEWDRAGALERVNRELDNEIRNMTMLSDARQVQNRLDAVAQQFLEKGVPLNEAETAAIRERIETIQRYARTQSELDRIYEETVGPQLTFNATQAASNDLLARGVITQQQYNEQMARAALALRNATDPLATYNDALTDQLALLGQYGPALERAQYLQGVENELRAQGKSLYDASTGALTAEGAALAARFETLQRGLYVQEQMNAMLADFTARDMFLSNMAAMYAEIERMRQEDLISEERANMLKAQLQNRYEEIRLENTRTFFGDLASLSSSGNAELAAIGKAAAVAQATIDGYVAVQKALASAPPPVNYALAAAAAVKAAVQVAGIMSTNVGGFKDGGQFMVGGEDGVDKNLITMAVTKGERVTVETEAQQRANDRAGGGSGGGVTVPVKIVNVTDPNDAVAAMDSPDGDRVILNAIRRNPSAVAQIVSSAS